MVFPRFPQNSNAAQAYQQMLAAGVNPASMDSGCHRVSYSSAQNLAVSGAQDRYVTACEVWTAYAQQGSLSSSLNIFQETAPWFYESRGMSAQAHQIFQNLDAKIAELRSRYAASAEAPLQIARALYDWLLDELRVLPVNRVEEQGLLASLENRRANCSEFFSIFKFVFGRAGLAVSPVFVFESANGDRSEHIATLFEHAGQRYLMDPLYHSFAARHRRWVPLTLREFWAWHFNNRALLMAEAGRDADVRRYFSQAEMLDPNNPHFPNNLGLKLEAAGDFRRAQGAYQRAIQIDPRFAESYLNLSASLINQSQSREGLIWARQGLAIEINHPGLNYNAALACFNLGNFQEAESFIARAIAHAPHPDYYRLQADIRGSRPRNSSVISRSPRF